MSQTISTSEVTIAQISTNPGPQWTNPNDVLFKVEYSKDYKGPKEMPEGSEVVLSKEVAADFAKKGIGSIVEKKADKSEGEEKKTTKK